MENKILQLKQTGFQIDGKTILKHINLSIAEGEFLTITGPSGSGKSTLLKLLASMLTPTEGEILYKGKPIQEYEPIDYRKRVSYTFQAAALFGDTVEENLSFPYEIRKKEMNKQEAIAALKSFGLSEDYLNKEVNSLSGGEKQRIALIRNILFLPDVLLLDEVTSSLDTENRQIISQAIKRLNKENKVTVLWITHNTEEIADADRKIEVVDGGIKEANHG
ncbi:MAG: ATP-binding cassette domain-containing protein [Pisciglobus halotolerans]|nr:ATP-binding cassette domain-containing protein [Pisciglobus halotolerans]